MPFKLQASSNSKLPEQSINGFGHSLFLYSMNYSINMKYLFVKL
jgi:hypothetical protein